jgi:hypothetical protein
MVVISLIVQIESFVDDHQPGFVQCLLVDAHGHKHQFVEKVPVVSSNNLFADSNYPQPGGHRLCRRGGMG